MYTVKNPILSPICLVPSMSCKRNNFFNVLFTFEGWEEQREREREREGGREGDQQSEADLS